jgi:hypothetical protein
MGASFPFKVSIFIAVCRGELHRLLASQPAISVIEEKGEGFENGENR